MKKDEIKFTGLEKVAAVFLVVIALISIIVTLVPDFLLHAT